MTRAEAIELAAEAWRATRTDAPDLEVAAIMVDALLEAGMTFGESPEPRFVFVHRPQGESK